MSTTGSQPSGADQSWVEPTMKVAIVARRLGVAPATLRTWARRYGLGPSAHTAGAHRQYSGDDMGRLLVMRRLTLAGVAPAEAARVALSRPVDLDLEMGGVRPLAVSGPRPALTDPEPAAGRPMAVAVPVSVPVVLTVDERIRTALARNAQVLRAAAANLDAGLCSDVVDSSIAAYGIIATWKQVVWPVLRDARETWRRAEAAVDVVPLLSDVVISAVSRAVPVAGGVPQVLMACAEGEEHTVSLYVLAGALWERGIPCRSLGARVPRETLAATARQTGPRATVLAAVAPVRDHHQLYGLPGVHPLMSVIATGPGWVPDRLPTSVRYLPEVDQVLDALT